MGKPTRSEVLKLVDYDSTTGAMTWRKRDASQITNTTGLKSWNSKFAGERAAHDDSDGRNVRVRLGAKGYLANKVVYLIMTGEWPLHRLVNKNYDLMDIRWENICAEKDRPRLLEDDDRKKRFPGVVWCGQEGKYLAFYHIEFIMMIVGLYRSSQEAVEARQLALAEIN